MRIARVNTIGLINDCHTMWAFISMNYFGLRHLVLYKQVLKRKMCGGFHAVLIYMYMVDKHSSATRLPLS